MDSTGVSRIPMTCCSICIDETGIEQDTVRLAPGVAIEVAAENDGKLATLLHLSHLANDELAALHARCLTPWSVLKMRIEMEKLLTALPVADPDPLHA